MFNTANYYIRSTILAVALLAHIFIKAQGLAKEREYSVELQSMKSLLKGGIKYLSNTQRVTTLPGRHYKGVWTSYMCMRIPFFFLGGKKNVEDSNCFSVAAIHNSLATIYLNYPEYDELLPMLDLSFDKIMSYRNGLHFNFWNLLPPFRDLKRGDKVGEQPLVRRPTNYKLGPRYINNAANVIEDADDTGLAYAAVALRKRYQPYSIDSVVLATDSIAYIFEAYRDHHRHNRHWYNFINGNDHDTGAYLTWLGEEYNFGKWTLAKVWCHNATFFLPFSECYPHPYEPYIPYGSNDLDAVVNANVLNTLALYDELDASGVESAISFIESKAKTKRYDRVGIYYPNRYHFPYAVSKAYAQGVSDLEQSVNYIQDFLLKSQNTAGSWSARWRLNKKDKLQSTAYSLNTLLNIGNLDDPTVDEAVYNAVQYLNAKAIHDERGIHWEGGVFFSGGTVVRNILWWKSDAYTTAVILEAFSKYRKHLESNIVLTK